MPAPRVRLALIGGLTWCGSGLADDPPRPLPPAGPVVVQPAAPRKPGGAPGAVHAPVGPVVVPPDTGADAPREMPRALDVPVAPRPALTTAQEYVARARAHLAWGHALDDLDAAAKLDPRSADARVARAEFWLVRGKLELADAALDVAARFDPRSADAARVRAAVHFAAERWGDAVAAADEAERLGPPDGRVYRGRAAARAARDAAAGVWDSAATVRDYTRALAFTPDDPEALLGRAEALVRLWEFDAALRDLDRVLALTPDHVVGTFRRAEVLRFLGRPAESLGVVDRITQYYATHFTEPDPAAVVRASATVPAFGGPVFNAPAGVSVAGVRPARPPVAAELLRAQLLSELGDDDRAVLVFDRVLARDPDNLEAKECRATVRFNRGEYAAALPDLDAVVGARPADGKCLLARGIARAKTGRAADALADLGETVRLTPADPTVRFTRGAVFLQAGAYRAAAAEFDDVVRLGTVNPAVLCGRGQARLFAGDCGRAERDFTLVLLLTANGPGRQAAHVHRGLARLGRLDWDGAAADFAAAGHDRSR